MYETLWIMGYLPYLLVQDFWTINSSNGISPCLIANTSSIRVHFPLLFMSCLNTGKPVGEWSEHKFGFPSSKMSIIFTHCCRVLAAPKSYANYKDEFLQSPWCVFKPSYLSTQRTNLGTWKKNPGIQDFYWKPSFLGSMIYVFLFRSVSVDLVKMDSNIPFNRQKYGLIPLKMHPSRKFNCWWKTFG